MGGLIKGGVDVFRGGANKVVYLRGGLNRGGELFWGLMVIVILVIVFLLGQ